MTDANQARYLDTPNSDTDPSETAEWREAFTALLASQGSQRTRFVLDEMARLARAQRVGWTPELNTPYVNTIAVDQQPVFPGDLEIEERLCSLMRWSALAMVVKANQAYGELGGHIANCASAADLFEVGNNHFFHGRTEQTRFTAGPPQGETTPSGGSEPRAAGSVGAADSPPGRPKVKQPPRGAANL
ncbi:MAG: pyruvate dehydrogenase (acetyl-transferring), homodimeric type, partial [Hydrogenophaga sp.]